MDAGQIIFVCSRLILGTLAAFLAITLWSKTRDIAWILMVIGTIVMYVEIVYSILELLGIPSFNVPSLGSISLAVIALPALRMAFLIAAFLVMVTRRKT